MHDVSLNGHSTPVGWAFCTGLNHADPVHNARVRLERFLSLPLNAFQSAADVHAVSLEVQQCLKLIPEHEASAMAKLFSRLHFLVT
jgi:hypothetical protein